MKRLIVMSVFVLFSFSSYAQRYAAYNPKMNILYADIPNPITVMVEGYKWHKLFLSTSDGSINRVDTSDTYVITPIHQGVVEVLIKVRFKDSLKEIGRERFRVYRVPNPIAFIHSGRQTLHEEYGALIMGDKLYLRADLENFDYDVRFNVDSFKITAYRKDSALFSLTNTGYAFNNLFYTLSKDMKVGDIIEITNIKSHLSKNVYILKNLKYVLKENKVLYYIGQF